MIEYKLIVRADGKILFFKNRQLSYFIQPDGKKLEMQCFIIPEDLFTKKVIT